MGVIFSYFVSSVLRVVPSSMRNPETCRDDVNEIVSRGIIPSGRLIKFALNLFGRSFFSRSSVE